MERKLRGAPLAVHISRLLVACGNSSSHHRSMPLISSLGTEFEVRIKPNTCASAGEAVLRPVGGLEEKRFDSNRRQLSFEIHLSALDRLLGADMTVEA